MPTHADQCIVVGPATEVPPTGLEPATCEVEARRSIQLSYGGSNRVGRADGSQRRLTTRRSRPPPEREGLSASRLTTARLIEQQWAASGVENPPVGSTTAAKIIGALDDGLKMARLIEPDEFPLDMFVDTLILLQQALEALEEKNAASREQ
jgi:hypothetical protein